MITDLDKYEFVSDKIKKWNIQKSRILKLLNDGRIEGAFKSGKQWYIPINSPKPKDLRFKKNKPNKIIP